MMTRILTLICFCICCTGSPAQVPAEAEGNMISQAMIAVQAYAEKHVDLLLDYTYPQIIVMAGGRDALKARILEIDTLMMQQGLSVDSIRLGPPGEIFMAGDQLHAVISQTVFISDADSIMISKSWLLGISNDQGARWYFMDTAQLSQELKSTFFPNFNEALFIPPPEQRMLPK